MVTGHFKLTNPDDMEAVIEIRMKVGEWRELRGQLQSGTWPSVDVGRVIDNLLGQADKILYANLGETR